MRLRTKILEFSSKDLDYHKNKLYTVDSNENYWKIKDYLEHIEHIELDAGSNQKCYLRQKILAYEFNTFKKLDRLVPEHIRQLESIKDNQLSLYEMEWGKNFKPEFSRNHWKLIGELENSIEFYKNNLYFYKSRLKEIELEFQSYLEELRDE